MANNERLISAWKLVSVLAKKFRSGMIHYDDLMATIADVPTVDAVEVVHGHWERVIPTKSAAKWSIKVSCSVCHRQGYTHNKYCPHCGAKMDGGNEDG